MDLEILGIATDPGSGLSPRVALEAGVHLLDPSAPLEPQYRELLKRYDRVFSLHASGRLCPLSERAKQEAPPGVWVIDTGLGSAGLGAVALRAAELLRTGVEEGALLAEIERLRREGRFLLASADLETLVKNRLLPPLGDRIGEALGVWGLLTLDAKGAFRTPPLPIPASRVPEGMASMLRRTFRRKPVRVRALLGEVPADFKERLKAALAKELTLEHGSLAPMDPLAQAQVGRHAVAVFAYPV